MLPKTVLGDGLAVSAIGFGGMALTPVYGEVDDAESLATLQHCLDVGVTFIDTALGIASVPIPGTRRAARVDENAASLAVELTGDQLVKLDAAGGSDLPTH